MKAWGCMDYNAECGVIVFAETRGKARSIAKGCAGLEDSEWCDIEVRRIKSLDGERTEAGDLDWHKDERLYYEAGWYAEDGARSCDCCGLYEYDSIPESTIAETEEGDICAACSAEDIDPLKKIKVRGLSDADYIANREAYDAQQAAEGGE